MTYIGCGIDRHEFQLWPNGTLMLTKYRMCVKPTGPVTDGVKVGKNFRYSSFEIYFLLYNVLSLNENKQT